MSEKTETEYFKVLETQTSAITRYIVCSEKGELRARFMGKAAATLDCRRLNAAYRMGFKAGRKSVES